MTNKPAATWEKFYLEARRAGTDDASACNQADEAMRDEEAKSCLCKECDGMTYVIREFGEIACPECQPDAYAEQINDIWLGY